MIRTLLTTAVRDAATDMVAAAGQTWPERLVVRLEQPARPEHGDYASNVAMQLRPVLNRAPAQIAADLRDRLSRLPYIARAEVAGPGFLNFFLDWGWWAAEGAAAAAGQAERLRAARQETKVVVEHTSVNPNKAMHVGHLRNACIGDTIVRLLHQTGYPVEVHNYIDDTGVQVADTVVGLLNLEHRGQYRRFGDFCWDLYAKVGQTYEAIPALKEERARVLHALEEGGNPTAWVARLVAERLVRELLAELEQFSIRYDLLVWESDIVGQGFWSAAFELLRGSPLFARETSGKLAGCWVLKQAGETAEDAEEAAVDGEHVQDKVLVRSNGTLTYTAKDIAYHLWKFGLLGKDFRYQPWPGARATWTSSAEGSVRKFGRARRVFNVIDRRQEYPQAMVKLALDTLGFADAAAGLRHVGYGVVSLSPATALALGVDTSGGRTSYAMSGRQGIGVKARDLLDAMAQRIEQERTRKTGVSSRAIAAGAVRYYLLRHSLTTEIIFDMDQALDIRGNTGPYLMYAHARAAGILRKAGLDGEPEAAAPPASLHEAEQALMRHLADWPDTLEQAAHETNITLLTAYCYELATLFHHLYEQVPVLRATGAERDWRLWLVGAFRRTLAEGLAVLGLPAPQKM